MGATSQLLLPEPVAVEPHEVRCRPAGTLWLGGGGGGGRGSWLAVLLLLLGGLWLWLWLWLWLRRPRCGVGVASLLALLPDVLGLGSSQAGELLLLLLVLGHLLDAAPVETVVGVRLPVW
jgi:hypothetical protein